MPNTTDIPNAKDIWNMIMQIIKGPPKPLLDPRASPGFTGQPPTPTPDPFQSMYDAGWREAGAPKPTPTPQPYFGMGQEEAVMEPALFDVIQALNASEEEKRNLSELSGQESSYGYAGPNITEKEESYGPLHLNVKAGRIDPTTGKAFTKEGAQDIQNIIQYALDEMRRTGGLGAWNPGAYDFYQKEIPERAKKKKFIKGKEK